MSILKKATYCCGLTAALIVAAVTGRADAPTPGTVSPYNTATAGYVDGTFNVQTPFSDGDESMTSCERTLDGSNWASATLSTSTCIASNLTCSDGQALTLNMRATNSLSQVGTAASVSRTCDTVAPTTTHNAPSGWQANDVTVTLTSSDSGSGAQNSIYCTDSTNSCAPNIYGGASANVSVTCGAGNVCQTYVRYQGRDNVNNTATVQSVLVQIDKQAPSGGSISYPNGNTSSPISVSVTDGNDGSGSGIGTRLLQRSQATLTHNSCGSFGAFTTIATNPTSPYSDMVSAGTCNKYQYDVADNAGNHAVYTSSNIAKVK